ncbi:hypothetical protein POVCU2_0020600 [Plasmodium ovale curtisi]|uniref:Uncharacterized protein n=1 Tax=Plasmodium ovale curtisi TaxID=864141 RepID=A0A1A8VSE2_PLAOA|nr:hypothetical protein POVCU2_0020600 [Plasmodium ovale curtisi]
MKNMLNYRTFVNNANTELLIKINGERSRSSSPTQKVSPPPSCDSKECLINRVDVKTSPLFPPQFCNPLSSIKRKFYSTCAYS